MADSGNQLSGRFSHFYTDCLSSFSALHMDLTQYLLLTFVTQCKALKEDILSHSIRNKTKNMLLFFVCLATVWILSAAIFITKLNYINLVQSSHFWSVPFILFCSGLHISTYFSILIKLCLWLTYLLGKGISLATRTTGNQANEGMAPQRTYKNINYPPSTLENWSNLQSATVKDRRYTSP